jgi:DnaB-like helicase N terminal domain/AAA domain
VAQQGRRSKRAPPDRVPHDEHAERATLGAVLLEPERLPDIAGLVPGHFFHQPNARIFAAICALADSGGAIDIVTVRHALGDRLSEVGGAAYVASLIDETVPSHVGHYARTIRQTALDRKAMEAANDYLLAVASSNGHGREDVLTAGKALGAAIAASVDEGDALVPDTPEQAAQAAATPVQWAIEPLTTSRGVRIFSGLGATGKTTLSMYLGLVAIQGAPASTGLGCDGGHSVAFLDAENSQESWWRKFYAVAAGLGIDPKPLVRSGRLVRFGMRRLYLDDPDTLQRVISTLRRATISEVVVDSLTAVHRADENSSGEMRHFFDEVVFRLRDEIQAGITILHHSRKPPQGVDDVIHSMRGSSDIRNAVETHVAVGRTGDVVRLDVTKQREAAETRPVHLQVTYGPGFIRYAGTSSPIGRPISTIRMQAGELLDTIPDASFSEALGKCIEAGVSRRTFIRAWKERHG